MKKEEQLISQLKRSRESTEESAHKLCQEAAKTIQSMLPKAGRAAGMYGETPRVQIGTMTICQQCEGMVWIEQATGEGFEVSGETLEPFLQKFFSQHF